MRACKFILHTLDPILAAQAQSDEPNSAKTYPFIPGSMVRGALIARAGNGELLDARDDATRKKFFDGTLRYMNCYPTRGAEFERMLPKPLSWFVPKDRAAAATETIFDAALAPIAFDEPKTPGGDFCWTSQEEENTQLHSPRIQMTVHNSGWERNYKNERASQVYRYEALAANQVFAGVIVAADENAELLKEIAALLKKGDLYLGGSHTAGYGRVRVLKAEIAAQWREYETDPFFKNSDPHFENQPPRTDVLTITCLSDVIVRNVGGQPDQALAELLDIPRENILESFAEVRLVGGFNRKWGLPLPQAWAIQMGSVFVFPARYEGVLQERVEQGIGERRAEGFGRIAVNFQRRRERQQSVWTESKLPAEEINLSEASRKVAMQMATRRLEDELKRALLERIDDTTGPRNAPYFKSLPRPAQLARARLAARAVWEDMSTRGEASQNTMARAEEVRDQQETSGIRNLDGLVHYFNGLSDLAKQEWRAARIGDQSFLKWIGEQLDERDTFWLNVKPIELGDVSVKMNKAQQGIYLARFLEGVLKRALQVAKTKREGGGR